MEKMSILIIILGVLLLKLLTEIIILLSEFWSHRIGRSRSGISVLFVFLLPSLYCVGIFFCCIYITTCTKHCLECVNWGHCLSLNICFKPNTKLNYFLHVKQIICVFILSTITDPLEMFIKIKFLFTTVGT